MSGTTQTGQIRSEPCSPNDTQQPVEKKPRLSPSINSSDRTSTAVALEIGKTHSRKQRQKQALRRILPEPFSAEDVLWRDVISLLGNPVVDQALEEGSEWDSPLAFKAEVELVVSILSSNGEALALAPQPHKPWVVVVPFALPGEKLLARVYRNSRLHSFADLIKVITPNPELRDSGKIQCKYFGSCSGCQYQMLSYPVQLELKRTVVLKAFQNFSGLPESSIPPIHSTIASPLQYGYRTKITPHFEAPPKKFRRPNDTSTHINEKPDWLKIGFNRIGQRHVMDIEECPIAAPVLNETYGPLRADITKNIYSYKKGASLLLRDSLVTSETVEGPATVLPNPIDQLSLSLEKHVCVTDHNATVREKVGEMLFEYKGGSFFQNNNSVLIPLTNYVREAIFAPSAVISPTHLVDAYCGSGLFSIMLSPQFSTIAGIELSSDATKFATHNARLNNLPTGKCTFHVGDAANIFATVKDFPADCTALVIDPPRKGCDGNFIEQVLAFRCRTVVYVSCNVHTQARDVGKILRGDGENPGYVLESLRGIDLFPQTAHVESVAVLRLQ